jgi:hypothetical protein
MDNSTANGSWVWTDYDLNASSAPPASATYLFNFGFFNFGNSSWEGQKFDHVSDVYINHSTTPGTLPSDAYVARDFNGDHAHLGGYTTGNNLVHYSFDPNAFTAETALPGTSRKSFEWLGAANDKEYACLGYKTSGYITYNDEYTDSTSSWATLGTGSQIDSNFSTLVADGIVWLTNTYPSDVDPADYWSYDIAGDSWAVGGDTLVPAREGHPIFRWIESEDKGYLAYGDAEANVPVDTFYPPTETWTRISSSPYADFGYPWGDVIGDVLMVGPECDSPFDNFFTHQFDASTVSWRQYSAVFPLGAASEATYAPHFCSLEE